MGIYIRGMKMPNDCLKCPFCLFADGYWKCLVDGSHADFGGTCRPSLCPLVPVPPHGRCVDADALIEDLKYDVELNAVVLDSMETVGDERRKIQEDKDFKQNCIFWIEDAPTIIPAEEGE